MTSEQIDQTAPTDISQSSWLKEICHQLARMNESYIGIEAQSVRRGPGRPKKVIA